AIARLAVCAWPGLAARHAILDVIGRLLTNRCQVEKLLFYGYVFSRFGKLPIFGRFVPQIISPIHVAASSTPEDAGGHSRTGLSPLTAIRNPRSPDYLHAPVRQEIIPPERAHPSQRSRSRCPLVGCWREAPPAGGAGTDRYLIRFLVGPEYMGRAGANSDQQPLANQGKNRGTHP